MLTNVFVKRFQEFVFTSYLRVPEIVLTDGIRLFSPVPQKAGAYVFLGDAKSFFRLMHEHSLIPGATYLVCKGSEPCPVIPDAFDMELNIIILDMSVREVIQHLNLLQTDGREDDPEGEQVLTAFFKTITVQNIASSETMAAWAARFPYPLKTFIACIVIHSEQTLHKPTYVRDISRVLRDFFPQTNLFYHNREWIIFSARKSRRATNCLSIMRIFPSCSRRTPSLPASAMWA